jgi:hypothetical protein
MRRTRYQNLLLLFILFILQLLCYPSSSAESIQSTNDAHEVLGVDLHHISATSQQIKLENSENDVYYDNNASCNEHSSWNAENNGKNMHNPVESNPLCCGNDENGISKDLAGQQYVILDQTKYNHELKFQKKPISEEYEDIIYNRKPLVDVFLGFLWKKAKPVVNVFSMTVSRHVGHIAKQ